MKKFEVTYSRLLAVSGKPAVVTSTIEADSIRVHDCGALSLLRINPVDDSLVPFFALPPGAWLLAEQADEESKVSL